jgi:hypothetical protein
MKRWVVRALRLGRAAAGRGEGRSLPEWELLWKGTALFEEKSAGLGVLSNRADFRLEPFGGAPDWGGLTLRAQAPPGAARR